MIVKIIKKHILFGDHEVAGVLGLDTYDFVFSTAISKHDKISPTEVVFSSFVIYHEN